MAHLRNGEVAVDRDANLSIYGPSGTRKRKASSAYLLVGGSSNTYKVTVSTEGAHFCVDHAGEPCKGNTYGKARKYGSVHRRDRNDPAQWCKHVAAALREPEKVAEAQDLTAQAFGQAPARKAPVKAEPKAEAPKAEPKAAPVSDARKRLAEIEAEAARLKASLVGEAVAALIAEHGREAVEAAIKAA